MCIDGGGRSPPPPPLYRFAWNKGSRVPRVLEEEKCVKVNDVVEINTWRPERRGRTDGRKDLKRTLWTQKDVPRMDKIGYTMRVAKK